MLLAHSSNCVDSHRKSTKNKYVPWIDVSTSFQRPMNSSTKYEHIYSIVMWSSKFTIRTKRNKCLKISLPRCIKQFCWRITSKYWRKAQWWKNSRKKHLWNWPKYWRKSFWLHNISFTIEIQQIEDFGSSKVAQSKNSQIISISLDCAKSFLFTISKIQLWVGSISSPKLATRLWQRPKSSL